MFDILNNSARTNAASSFFLWFYHSTQVHPDTMKAVLNTISHWTSVVTHVTASGWGPHAWPSVGAAYAEQWAPCPNTNTRANDSVMQDGPRSPQQVRQVEKSKIYPRNKWDGEGIYLNCNWLFAKTTKYSGLALDITTLFLFLFLFFWVSTEDHHMGHKFSLPDTTLPIYSGTMRCTQTRRWTQPGHP